MSGRGLDRLSWLLYPLFFVSGASSLIFENLWQRKMTHVFGASAPSITVILTSGWGEEYDPELSSGLSLLRVGSGWA